MFNGEIYNHRDLRHKLARRGHRFRTKTDTEVILHLYEEYGTRCVEHLRGMFTIAIVDGQRLFLARDPLGIKPLYYAYSDDGTAFFFASEIKAILQCSAITPALDTQALADHFLLGYVAGAGTFFHRIRSVLPGHWMSLTASATTIDVEDESFYSLPTSVNDELSFDEAKERLGELLVSAVDSHLVADVRIGLALSGGLDSSLLALEMKQHRDAGCIDAYSVADDLDHPDIISARRVADAVGAVHHIQVMSFPDYLEAIPSCILAEEQPSNLRAAPLLFLCRRVAESLKVCISGEGADELFGGYAEYFDRSRLMSAIGSRLPVLKEAGVLPSDEAMGIIRGLGATTPGGHYLAWIFAHNMRWPLVRQHLEIADKYAMAAGVECRVPYVDQQLAEFVSGLPVTFKANEGLRIHKYILKCVALERYGARVVESVLRPKLGFPAALSIHRRRFQQLCDTTLGQDYVRRHELGHYFRSATSLLLFELFEELFIANRGAVSGPVDILDFMRSRA